MEYQKTCITELLELIRQNPELPIIPMVNSEIIADDYCAFWMGSWGKACVTKYIRGEEHVFFYDESDMESCLEELEGYEWYENCTDAEALEKYRALDWIDCIVVYINTPD